MDHFPHPIDTGDKFWQFITATYFQEVLQFVADEQWDTTNLEEIWGRCIVRINKLIQKEDKSVSTPKAFLSFLKQAVLDEIIVRDIHLNGGEKAGPYLKKRWFTRNLRQLNTQIRSVDPVFEDVFSRVFEQLCHRVFEKSLLRQSATLEDYFLDELIIHHIESGPVLQRNAYEFLKSHWFEYLTKKAPFQAKEDIFATVMANLYKRICLPQKGQRLVLEHTLKTYLYRCVVNELIKISPKRTDVATSPGPSEDQEPETAATQNRWERLNITQREMHEALNALLPECRELFIYDSEGFKDAHIADELNIQIGTVRNRRTKCNNHIEVFILNKRNNP